MSSRLSHLQMTTATSHFKAMSTEPGKNPKYSTSKMETPWKRHCWECRRRCLVCDFTRPGCKRCSASDVECPGYDEVKPIRLKWLAPGNVKSRSRRMNRTLSTSAKSKENDLAIKETTNLAVTATGDHLTISRFEMRTDVWHLPQAAMYFNSCIYQDLAPMHELGQNPHIYQLSPTQIQMATAAPDYLKFGMVCMTLSHRINQIKHQSQSNPLLERFYMYWGFAVRSLRDHLNVKDSHGRDVLIAGILTLLLTDIQQGTSLNWRGHLEAVQKLVMLHGGFHEMAKSARLEPVLLVFWSVAVIGNTTCPVSDLSMTAPQLDALELLTDQYAGAISPFQMCPLPLFAEIIQINHLRFRAREMELTEAESLSQEAGDVLWRVERFSSETWARSKPSLVDDWTAIANVYQSAVALYCILSLQSLSLFPMTMALQTQRALHTRLLQALIEKSLPSRRIRRFMVWPLVALGVGAVQCDAYVQAFVVSQLQKLGWDLGTQVPLTARRVLQSFWDSGKTRWDDCFDRPYAFTTQIAVDTSRLMPY